MYIKIIKKGNKYIVEDTLFCHRDIKYTNKTTFNDLYYAFKCLERLLLVELEFYRRILRVNNTKESYTIVLK
jgi:hypothetical protein